MKRLVTTILIAVLLVGVLATGAYAASCSNGTTKNTAQINCSALNLRTGSSIWNKILDVLCKGEQVCVLQKLGDWCLVKTQDGKLGMVCNKYLTNCKAPAATPAPTANPTATPKPSATPAPTATPKPSATPAPTATPGQNIGAMQQQMLNLVNQERTSRGLAALKWDANLAVVAQDKAQDMVDNNYFSHTSPTYGSPFDMMRAYGITYRTAGENLAGYNSVEGAHNGLMNSDGHRANILNANFTHIGIGVVKSPRYGYVFVQMFIGK